MEEGGTLLGGVDSGMRALEGGEVGTTQGVGVLAETTSEARVNIHSDLGAQPEEGWRVTSELIRMGPEMGLGKADPSRSDLC